MEITWLGVAVIAALLIMGGVGYRRGFIKEILSFFCMFLTLSLAWTINPYVNDFLMTKTPVYERIEENCQQLIWEKTDGDEQEESSLIEKIGLPDVLQKNILDNNTQETYESMAVNSLVDYISNCLARSIVNGASFVLSYILAWFVLKFLACLLNAVASLPIISGANKITGGIVGIVKGIVMVWIAFLVLTVFCSTEFGGDILGLIERDAFLQLLYRYDIFVKFFMNVI